jgi:mxaJ protein
MSFLCKALSIFLLIAAGAPQPVRAGETAPAAGKRLIRVAADPNNLPFSNDKLEGFENKIAELIAHELHAELQYIWHAQRRGFFRQTLKEGDADIVMGAPAGYERALTTIPYYRSTYVFAARKSAASPVESFDDPRLKELKIGVHLIGDDGINTPPAQALVQRGILTNVTGYTLYGDYSKPNPPAEIMHALGRREIDLAVVWGPFAGYFSQFEPEPMQITPIPEKENSPLFQFAWDISIGVKRGNKELRDQLNAILRNKKSEIAAILDGYHVPQLPLGTARVEGGEK